MYINKKDTVIGVSFQKLKDNFLTQMEVANYTYASIKTYKYPLDKFFLFLLEEKIQRIQEVTHDLIEKYRLGLIRENYKTSTLEVYMRTVKLLFRYLESTGEVFVNPASEIAIPRPERNMQYVPSTDEMKRFLDIDTSTPTRVRNKALFETAYSCGARLNELRMLDLKDCNLAKEQLQLMGKGRKERIVPIGMHSIFWLNKYIREARPLLQKGKNEDALFLARRGNRISIVGIQKQVAYHQRETAVPVTMHAIRRACATHMLQGGANPVEIQMLLGHADLSNLSQYLDVTITELKETHKRSLIR